MPRKTKKQKIVAEYKRKLRTLPQQSTNLELQVRQKEVVVPKKTNPGRIEKLQKDTSYIASDLRKTIILSVLAIGAELVIYFVTN